MQNNMKNITRILIAFYVILTTVQISSAQLVPAPKQDALFPNEGKTSLTIWSGIPYIGIAEFG